MSERKSKSFWYADFEAVQVYEVTGYECPDNPRVWWCPDIGASVTEHFQLFASRNEAIGRVRQITENRIKRDTARLAELDPAC